MGYMVGQTGVRERWDISRRKKIFEAFIISIVDGNFTL